MPGVFFPVPFDPPFAWAVSSAPFLKSFPRNAKANPPAAHKTTKKAMAAMRDFFPGDAAAVADGSPPLAGVGRGLPTCEAERMNFASGEVGACGTTIF